MGFSCVFRLLEKRLWGGVAVLFVYFLYLFLFLFCIFRGCPTLRLLPRLLAPQRGTFSDPSSGCPPSADTPRRWNSIDEIVLMLHGGDEAPDFPLKAAKLWQGLAFPWIPVARSARHPKLLVRPVLFASWAVTWHNPQSSRANPSLVLFAVAWQLQWLELPQCFAGNSF